ncbi:unnamed protein product [Echinostoma caproni]|uniref:GP-PDE domain-containing protein n=1 Tax=Echinostoma caproni TaxID=27848 RepID=A0A183AVF6_9TREM|nr:unnamed protein product [Echinostoma caproni]
MAYDVGALGVMTDYPKRLLSFLDRNPMLAVNRSKYQPNGLHTTPSKQRKQTGRHVNDTMLTQFAVLRSKRPICRTSASTTLAHTGGDLHMMRD